MYFSVSENIHETLNEADWNKTLESSMANGMSQFSRESCADSHDIT